MELNGKELAKRMRDAKCVDRYGNVVCDLDSWEKIACFIEEQSDTIDKLSNSSLKNDREQFLHIIRCKDCRFCHHNRQLHTYRCLHFGCVMRPNDYCSWGESPDNIEKEKNL